MYPRRRSFVVEALDGTRGSRHGKVEPHGDEDGKLGHENVGIYVGWENELSIFLFYEHSQQSEDFINRLTQLFPRRFRTNETYQMDSDYIRSYIMSLTLKDITSV
jgi:hypothetical protein